MKFRLKIKPAINPRTRHRIEGVLKEDGYGVIGGGQMTDGSLCDISFEREDARDALGDPPEEKENTCESCTFFRNGLCKKKPPVIVVHERYGSDEEHVKNYLYVSNFPDVHKTDLCGEWKG